VILIVALFEMTPTVFVIGILLVLFPRVLSIVKWANGAIGAPATRSVLTLFMIVRIVVVVRIELVLSHVILLMEVFHALICMKSKAVMKSLVPSTVR
jgi:hypothetical protein